MDYELTDFEWTVIAPLLPNKPRGVARVDDRRVLNGIFWVLRTGAPWRALPKEYGPRTTCYNRFVRWRAAGVWDRILTDAVLEEVKQWQDRPFDPVYPVVFLDALRVKMRDDVLVRNKAVYVALGLTTDGDKEVLGLWVERTEGAKFWLRVLNDLKTRGVQDILIAVVDGLKGLTFPYDAP